MIQLTLATTLFGAMSAAAAIDAGLLGEPRERVLVVANNAPIPEVAPPLVDTPGAAAVLTRFDRVVDLGALLSPQRPAHWRVATMDEPAQERLLRAFWGLGDEPVELVIESVHVPPAATLAAVLADAPITVLSEGLMSYGPTRNPQTHTFGQRITSMVYLDLVEGLDPLLLSEHGITYRAIPPATYRALTEEVCAAADVPVVEDERPSVLLLGQYLSELKLISPRQESQMQVSMLDAALELGASHVLFKPHPSAASTNTAALLAAAEAKGLTIEIVDSRLFAEAVMATHRLVGVVAGFSTGLATAERVFGLPTRSVGTEVLLRTLDPFQNSNRIPLTIVDHRGRHRDGDRDIEGLRRLTVAVAYAMQPQTLAARRDEAVAFLDGAAEGERRRYFTQGRLNVLGLPGAQIPTGVRRVAKGTIERLPSGVAEPVYGYLRKARSTVVGGQAR
ncbi:polysialyltransferase family glycosyltransferase [Demequina iriomotensis]|uniref:polysialyltransferase family glycosyltransferase n=1 Tax=Demequina iriomotensis TaxID=1536641 RepID=UPI000785808D|nr:polysialyltransferase family glycosyltransferase [Demequina iriomotensis]